MPGIKGSFTILVIGYIFTAMVLLAMGVTLLVGTGRLAWSIAKGVAAWARRLRQERQDRRQVRAAASSPAADTTATAIPGSAAGAAPLPSATAASPSAAGRPSSSRPATPMRSSSPPPPASPRTTTPSRRSSGSRPPPDRPSSRRGHRSRSPPPPHGRAAVPRPCLRISRPLNLVTNPDTDPYELTPYRSARDLARSSGESARANNVRFPIVEPVRPRPPSLPPPHPPGPRDPVPRPAARVSTTAP
jgi:hypothetical protein